MFEAHAMGKLIASLLTQHRVVDDGAGFRIAVTDRAGNVSTVCCRDGDWIAAADEVDPAQAAVLWDRTAGGAQ